VHGTKFGLTDHDRQ